MRPVSHLLIHRLTDLRLSWFLVCFICFIWGTSGCSIFNSKKNEIQNSSNESQTNTSQSEAVVDPQTNSYRKSQVIKKKFFFDWPLQEARMSRGYLPKVKRKRKRPHRGIDLVAPRGTPVLASHDGLVIYAGKEFKGYGKMVMIEIDDYATLYGHLDKIVVFEGQKVKQGQVIGALGNTGRSSGPHLHFEIRKLDGPIDPLPLLPAGEALTNDVDTGPEETF